MTPPTDRIAPQICRLLHTLRRQIDADLRDLRLCFVPRLPVDGFAFGNVIALSPRLLEREPRELLHVVVHELTHVFQQRAGRVRAERSLGTIPFALDPALEAEAEHAARQVVAGGRITWRTARPPCTPSPVLQPLISLGGQPYTAVSDFSAKFVQVLALIPSGNSWLEWAMHTPAPAFSFASESALLGAIQTGLHGTADIVFPSAGLRLAPTLVFSFDEPDFSNVVNALAVGQLTPASFTALAAHQVRTERDFASVAAALTQYGVAGTPALASQTLAEQIALWNCFCGATPSSPPLPAAQFASSAQSPTDFVAMFNFYSTVSAVDPAPGAPASLWTALTPLAFPHLACPTCDPQTPNDNLAAFIAAQFAQSGPIGFPTLAVALAEIAAHSGLPLTGPLPADAALAINLYLSNVSALVAASASGSSAPPRITLLQDGLTRWIDYANDASLARFQLDPSGLISLRRFAPSAPAQ